MGYLKSFKIISGDKTYFDVNFIRESEDKRKKTERHFFSLILGDNGAGKSFLFRQLILSFMFLYGSKKKGIKDELKYDRYEMNLFAPQDLVVSSIIFKRDGEELVFKGLDKRDKDLLPKRILAVTESFPDKFIYSENLKKDAYYYYLGLQNHTNAVFKRKSNDAIIDTLIEVYKDSNKAIAFEEVLKSIGYEEKPIILFENIRYLLDKSFIEENESKIKKAFEKKKGAKKAKKNEAEAYSLFFKRKETEEDGELISWEWMSSGEKHIIRSFSSIIRYIIPGSLVLIDEPEVSLHPSWQIQYIPLLEKVFGRFQNCQFIIASHSHFLATGLPLEKSFLLSLSRKNDYEHATTEYNDFYSGLSAERVLYEVFGVATTRNIYFQKDLELVISFLERTPEERGNAEKEIIEAFVRLKSYIQDSRDPLHSLISEGERYFNV